MPTFKMRYLLIALVPLAVAGCVSTEDQRAADQEKCASYGYRPGSNSFADCMRDQDEQRADDQRRTMNDLERQDRRDRKRRNDLQSTASPSVIDNRPQYDKDGNPNFDTQGNYIGCHGIGCQVDNPDADDNN
ncbi:MULTISPECIES: hypothetical protein [unclassified Mesorhizobium]|uniref:hypothetical protein n=1 Tax=unclassified Mesorhizobium TaxID=325217 RepID=UPI00112D7B5C|nr:MULTISPECIES: hypothetical protein [unclassified Mesorhizobium]TPN48230.1 hypothetical protein FJ978_21720 [Mesorhizobium sp. B1-1-7]TPN52633.1 hypothetical protein FJ976_12730 [Mesorhizobium sp. B1-1-9]